MSSKSEKKITLTSELRKSGKIDNNFIDKLSDLRIEELIALKLESSAKMMNGKLYGIPLWYTLPYAVRDSLMDFVSRNCKTKSDMSSTLGIPYEMFIQIYKKYIKE